MSLKDMQEKREKLLSEARERLDQVTANTDESRAAELETQHDNAMAELDRLDADINRQLDLEKREKVSNELREQFERGDNRRPMESRDVDAVDENDGDELSYKDTFVKALRYGVSGLTSEERGFLRQNMESLPEEVRAQSVGTDAAGGYSVPDEFSGEIDKSMAAWGPMWDANIVREMSTGNGRSIDWPTVDDTANTGRTKAENAEVDDDGTDDIAFGNKKLDAYVFDTGMVRIPIELLQDSEFNMQQLLDELFGERLGRGANQKLTVGSGTNEPNGILTASTLGKTAAAAAAISPDEILDLVHSVDPAYRSSPKSRYQFNDKTLAVIKKLKDGQNNYLWQMGDVRSGEPNLLQNHPYSINQAMPDIATGTKPILFGDHGRYVVRKVQGFQVITLRERYAERFQIGMVGFKRFDGELLNDQAVKHLVMA